VEADPQLRSTLESLPARAMDLYKGASPSEKATLATQIHGHTSVLFSTIDHRQAFISGSAMGRNTFDYLSGQLDDKVKAGTVSAADAARQKNALAALKPLSPSQREAFIRLLEADTGTSPR